MSEPMTNERKLAILDMAICRNDNYDIWGYLLSRIQQLEGEMLRHYFVGAEDLAILRFVARASIALRLLEIYVDTHKGIIEKEQVQELMRIEAADNDIMSALGWRHYDDE